MNAVEDTDVDMDALAESLAPHCLGPDIELPPWVKRHVKALERHGLSEVGAHPTRGWFVIMSQGQGSAVSWLSPSDPLPPDPSTAEGFVEALKALGREAQNLRELGCLLGDRPILNLGFVEQLEELAAQARAWLR